MAHADDPKDFSHPATDDDDDDEEKEKKEEQEWEKIHGREKGRFDIPATIAFTITDIGQDTPQDGVALIRAYDLDLKRKSRLIIAIAPAADFFVDPRGVNSYPTSALRYESRGAIGGIGAGTTLGRAGHFLPILTCDRYVTSCQVTLKFTLTAAVRPTIAGDHTLGLMYRVSTIH